MYEYYDRQNRLVAKSESKVVFNDKLFPSLASIKPKLVKKGTNSNKADSNKTKE